MTGGSGTSLLLRSFRFEDDSERQNSWFSSREWMARGFCDDDGWNGIRSHVPSKAPRKGSNRTTAWRNHRRNEGGNEGREREDGNRTISPPFQSLHVPRGSGLSFPRSTDPMDARRGKKGRETEREERREVEDPWDLQMHPPTPIPWFGWGRGFVRGAQRTDTRRLPLSATWRRRRASTQGARARFHVSFRLGSPERNEERMKVSLRDAFRTAISNGRRASVRIVLRCGKGRVSAPGRNG